MKLLCQIAIKGFMFTLALITTQEVGTKSGHEGRAAVWL